MDFHSATSNALLAFAFHFFVVARSRSSPLIQFFPAALLPPSPPLPNLHSPRAHQPYGPTPSDALGTKDDEANLVWIGAGGVGGVQFLWVWVGVVGGGRGGGGWAGFWVEGVFFWGGVWVGVGLSGGVGFLGCGFVGGVGGDLVGVVGRRGVVVGFFWGGGVGVSCCFGGLYVSLATFKLPLFKIIPV